jgi:hypothetical protein
MPIWERGGPTHSKCSQRWSRIGRCGAVTRLPGLAKDQGGAGWIRPRCWVYVNDSRAGKRLDDESTVCSPLLIVTLGSSLNYE